MKIKLDPIKITDIERVFGDNLKHVQVVDGQAIVTLYRPLHENTMRIVNRLLCIDSCHL